MRPLLLALCLCVLPVDRGACAQDEREPGPAAPEGPPIACEVHLLAVGPNEGCAVGDVDRDGVLDVVAGPLWFAGPTFVPRTVRDVPEVGGGAYLANNGEHLIDVDGDGWLDVVSGSFNEPELWWFRNPGADALRRGLRWEPHELGKAGVTNEATLAHDLDGDGTPELCVDSWNDHAAMLGWRIVEGGEAQRFGIGARGNGHGLGFGDIDGDGDDDVVCKIGWYEHPDGRPFEGPWPLHRDFDLGRASCPILVVDVDADGRRDLVVGRGHGYGLHWHRQLEPADDGATRWDVRAIDRSISQLHTVAWVDLTGTGRAGILTGKRTRAHEGADPGTDDPAGLWFYERSADGGFVRRVLAGSAGRIGTGLQIVTADLDADGRLDVVVSGKTGTAVLLQRDGE